MVIKSTGGGGLKSVNTPCQWNPSHVPLLTGDVFKRILTSMMEFFGKIAKDYYYYGVYFEKLLNV